MIHTNTHRTAESSRKIYSRNSAGAGFSVDTMLIRFRRSTTDGRFARATLPRSEPSNYIVFLEIRGRAIAFRASARPLRDFYLLVVAAAVPLTTTTTTTGSPVVRFSFEIATSTRFYKMRLNLLSSRIELNERHIALNECTRARAPINQPILLVVG